MLKDYLLQGHYNNIIETGCESMSALIAIYGLIIGSFINVCIYRIPKGEEVVFTPSHCFSCGYRLKWYDLIPVFSYAFLQGKCRNCGESISIQYPLVELANSAMYVWIYLIFGSSIETVLYMFLASALLTISVIDFKHMIIPDSIVVFIGILAIINLIFNIKLWLYFVVGFFVVSVILLVIAIITKGGMGGGDIKMMAVAGLLIGWDKILLALMLGAILGSVVGVTLIALKIIERKQFIPFGPFLAAGVFASALYGEEIIGWYLKLYQ